LNKVKNNNDSSTLLVYKIETKQTQGANPI